MAAESETFTLKVKSPKLPQGLIEASGEMTIFDLKTVINLQVYEDMPIDHMRTVFRGKILDNDQTLSESGLKQDMTVIVVKVVPKAAKPEAQKSEASAGTQQQSETNINDVAANLQNFFNSADVQDAGKNVQAFGEQMGRVGMSMFANVMQAMNTSNNQDNQSQAEGSSSVPESAESNEKKSDEKPKESENRNSERSNNPFVAFLPMINSAVENLKQKLTLENVKNFIMQPSIMNALENVKKVPDNIVKMLNKLYENSPVIQSFVNKLMEMVEKLKSEAKGENAKKAYDNLLKGLLRVVNFSKNAAEKVAEKAQDVNWGNLMMQATPLLVGLMSQNPGAAGLATAFISNLGGSNSNAAPSTEPASSEPTSQPAQPASDEMDLDDILDSSLKDAENDKKDPAQIPFDDLD